MTEEQPFRSLELLGWLPPGLPGGICEVQMVAFRRYERGCKRRLLMRLPAHSVVPKVLETLEERAKRVCAASGVKAHHVYSHNVSPKLSRLANTVERLDMFSS